MTKFRFLKNKNKDDSAQENYLVDSPEFRQAYRNALFDRLVNSGIECYVALRKDFIKNNFFHHNLFCGQVGEIENVILEKTDKKCYLVIFTDYKKTENEYARYLIEPKDLLPLFCFDPNTYTKIKTKHTEDANSIPVLQTTSEDTIHEIRTNWEKYDFSVSLDDNELQKHNKVETRFNRGQLVTLLFDFEQTFEIENKTEKCIIQAGQTGIISNEKNDNDNTVEVTFWSIPLGSLALEGEDFVSLPQQLDPLSCAINPWERKISIDKDYLFPLYCEELELSM